MNKFQIRKAAYTSIVKDGKTHQETFNELGTKTSVDLKWLANEVSKIPSKSKNEKQSVLRYIYMGLLLLAITLRVVGMIALTQFNSEKLNVLLVLMVLGVVIPLLGIIGSVKRSRQSYAGLAIISFVIIFDTLSKIDISQNPLLLIGLFPYVGIIILALYIPSLLKTPYKVELLQQEGPDGTSVLVSQKYTFDTL